MPRFLEAVGEDGERLIIDTSFNPPIVMCGCIGFNARYRSEYVLRALQEYEDGLLRKLGMIDCPAVPATTGQRRGPD